MVEPIEAKLKHLEFIQRVIDRLATDSFRMKGWAVVLVSALLVLLAREGRVEFAYIGFVPVLIFWGLNGYFLRQERSFRDLYDHVRVLDEPDMASVKATRVKPDKAAYHAFFRAARGFLFRVLFLV